MSWHRTPKENGQRKKAVRMNTANEILLDCVENTSHDNHFWIYNRTAMLNSYNGLERTRIMKQVTHTIKGNNGVTIFIICGSPRMTDERAEVLARGFYNGDTLSYRLD